MVRAYSKRGHGIQRVCVDLFWYKREDEIRNTFNGVGQRGDDVIGDKQKKNIRADVERPEHCKMRHKPGNQTRLSPRYTEDEYTHQNSIQDRMGTGQRRSVSTTETRLHLILPVF